MFRNNIFFLTTLLSTVFTYGCERVDPAMSERAPMVAQSQQATLASRGYRMSIDTDDDLARITTASSGVTPLPSDPLIMPGPGVPEIAFTGQTLELENENGELVTHQVLAVPNDGRTYWAVPFNPNWAPVNVTDIIIIIILDNCMCGSNASACQNSGTGCVTSVCSSCSRRAKIIIMDKVYQPPFGDPFALVAANTVEHNGVLYQ
jgi:hypothetical protein